MNISHTDFKLHEELREKARAITNFKMHRTVFFLANILIWLVSAFLFYAFKTTWMWAIFPTAIWGVILIFHYFWTFKWNKDRVEKEYQKLLKSLEKRQLNEQSAKLTDEATNQ